MKTASVLSKSQRALEWVSLACRTAAVLLLALMVVLVVGQVVGRNAFDLGMPWADELARFSGVALVFLCVPLLALRGQHVAVDLVPLAMRGALRRICLVLAEGAVLAFSVLTLIGFQSFLSRAWKFSTPAIGIPNWIFYAPALIGFVLLMLVAALRIADLLCGCPVDRDDQVDGEEHKIS